MARSLKARKPVVGVDIEPGYVSAAAVTVNGSIRVERAGTVPLGPGVVRDGEVVDGDSLAESLKLLFKENKLDRRVRLGVASPRIVVRLIHAPPLDDPKALDAAIRFQAQEQVPMPLDQAVLDYQALGVVDTPEGPRQRVVIVAARRDSIMRLLAAARAAGLKPEGIDLSAFAMIRALGASVPAGADAGPSLYMNVGGLTNLAVAEGQACTFTRVSSASIGDVISQLAERRELTLDHARQWLHHVGLVTPVEDVDGDPEIVQEARALLADGARRIADEIRNSLEFYATQEAARPVERAVLTGPAASIPGLADELGRTLGLPLTSAAVEAGSSLTDVEPSAVTVAAGLAVTEAPA